jgi:hypothetical protein
MATLTLSLAVAVRAEPTAATELFKGALSRAGAAITSAQRLGNQALVFGLEFDARNAGALHGEQRAVSQLLDATDDKLDRAARELLPDTEILAALHVTLVHEAPDERVALPRVPG